MIEKVQYTSEFDFYDSDKPYLESVFNILISHDNSKESIGQKFVINFLNSDNDKISEVNINTWFISEIKICNYYGRAEVNVTIKDPKGVRLQPLKSGGFSLSMDEEWNINKLKTELTTVLKKVRRYSLFLDYRSRLDFVNTFKKQYPNEFKISHWI